MNKNVGIGLTCLALAGCGLLTPRAEPVGGPASDLDPVALPRSMGEAESGYTYVPIDPFPVRETMGGNCLFLPGEYRPRTVFLDLLPSLPDNAVRMLVERFDASGNVSYGVAKTGAMNESYRVTVDYINADTINQPVSIAKFMRQVNGDVKRVSLLGAASAEFIKGSESYTVKPLDPYPLYRPGSDQKNPDEGDVFNVPVYIGVGLRVSANVYVIGANANISGIGVIGAEADAERLRGSLVVQTLGVNGKSVAAALPIQSELNRTTAQNAIAAVGTLKALLYAEETVKLPRVVGMYMPFPGGKPLVNALISALSTARIEWRRPCREPSDKELGEFTKAAMKADADERKRMEQLRKSTSGTQ